MIGSVDITIVVMLPESDSAASHENDSSRWVGWEVVQSNVGRNTTCVCNMLIASLVEGGSDDLLFG